MRHQMTLLASQGRQQITHWLQTRAQECQLCRECRGQVSPLDQVCASCGASDPARINISAGVAVAAVTIGLLLLGLWIF